MTAFQRLRADLLTLGKPGRRGVIRVAVSGFHYTRQHLLWQVMPRYSGKKDWLALHRDVLNRWPHHKDIQYVAHMTRPYVGAEHAPRVDVTRRLFDMDRGE